MQRRMGYLSPRLKMRVGLRGHCIRPFSSSYVLLWFRLTPSLNTFTQQKFYYRGVKLIFSRRRDIALIRDRIANGGTPLTRAEFRLIQTQRDDVKKCVVAPHNLIVNPI